MKIKIFVAREIQYFELGSFSFNSYVYYLTCGFIASTRAFNLAARAFSLLTHEFELVTREFELVTREFELVTRGFELVTRVLLFHKSKITKDGNGENVRLLEITDAVLVHFDIVSND